MPQLSRVVESSTGNLADCIRAITGQFADVIGAKVDGWVEGFVVVDCVVGVADDSVGMSVVKVNVDFDMDSVLFWISAVDSVVELSVLTSVFVEG